MNLNTVNLNIFSLILKKGTNDSTVIEDALKNAIPCSNLYLQGNAYRMNECLYYFESCANENTRLHILARQNKYRDEKTLQKRDALIRVLRGLQRFNNIKSGKIEALWLQWQKIPDHILAKYLCRKNDKSYA